ncbi:hypothetical protein [Henriciella sp.]|uniref:hypothetical protein n=1 Tax=Henriciella sp. TaxID=1968823 RepID=UPI00263583D3|nr:hypothetical protein [Henriciella sp.]
MSSRLRAAAAALLFCSASLPATAQIESGGLGDISPWTASFLERGEDGLGRDLWSNSDPEYLIALFEHIDVSRLSPAETSLLSLALRSPAQAPEGDLANMLQAERIRLLLALGERRAAASLASQTGDEIEGINPDVILSDNRLARGEVDVVCAQANVTGDGRFWSELRALCTLKNGEEASAELAIEIAGQQEGAEPWFTEAAVSVLADLDPEDRPAARYGSGLEMAMSEMAGLEPDGESLSLARPDLALLIAEDEGRPLALRLAAAGIAAEAGLISGEQHRALYEALIEEEDFEPETPVEAAFVLLAREPEPEPEPVSEIAAGPAGPVDLRAMTDDWSEPIEPEDLEETEGASEEEEGPSLIAQQALAVKYALARSASDAVSFSVTARLFEEALDTLPAGEDTADSAIVFAAAALASGDLGLTMTWLDAIPEDAEDATHFEAALLEGYALLFGDRREASDLEPLVSRLLETGYEENQRQAALRLFSVWSGFDVPMPVMARSALTQSQIEAPPVEPGILLGISSAERAGASGEALLTILTQTDGQIESLSGPSLAVLLDTLKQMGAGEAALALALDTGELWTLAAERN